MLSFWCCACFPSGAVPTFLLVLCMLSFWCCACCVDHDARCRFAVLVCGTLVYSRGDEVQSKKEQVEYEAHAGEEGQAQPSLLMPGQLLLSTQRYLLVCSCSHLDCLVFMYSILTAGSTATATITAGLRGLVLEESCCQTSPLAKRPRVMGRLSPFGHWSDSWGLGPHLACEGVCIDYSLTLLLFGPSYRYLQTLSVSPRLVDSEHVQNSIHSRQIFTALLTPMWVPATSTLIAPVATVLTTCLAAAVHHCH